MLFRITQHIKQRNFIVPIRYVSSLDHTYYVKKMFPIPKQEQKQEKKQYKNRQNVVFLDYTYYMYENPTKQNEFVTKQNETKS